MTKLKEFLPQVDGMAAHVATAVMLVSDRRMRSATVAVSKTKVVRASKVSYAGKPTSRRARYVHIVLTVGQPNYVAREKIKREVKAGKTFPLHFCRYYKTD